MKTWAKITLLAAFLAVMPATAYATDFPALFNTVAYKNESLDALPQWQRVLKEIAREKETYSRCVNATDPCSPKALLAWRAMIKGQAGQSKMAQIRAVNRFVNQWAPKADIDNHKQMDFWSSPLTFLRQSGDCEDYAIIKYVSLRELGFDADQMRIVVVRDTLRNLAHAVLAIEHEGEIFILDNLYQAVLPQVRVRQYLPYYSVNEQARWAHQPTNALMLSSSNWSITPSAETIGNAVQAIPTKPETGSSVTSLSR